MKKLVTSYTFTAASKTIASADFTSLEKIQLITNVTDNIIIYSFAEPTKGGSLASTTLTLTYDTTGMSDSDKLQIFVDEGNSVTVGSSALPTGAATAANQQTDALTDTQLRATAVPVSGTVTANIGTVSTLSTATKQDTGNTSVASIDTKTPALGQALAASSVPVVLTSSQLTTLTPPAAITGFATSAKQDSLLTELQLKADLTETQPVSLASVPSHAVTNAGTFATQAAQSGTWTVQPGNTANTTAWKVDGSAVTQPVSASSLPLPSGAATSALQTQPGVDIGDVTINNASGASAVNIQDGGNSITVDNGGTFATQATLAAETTKVIGTVNQGTSPWVTSNATTSVVGNGAAATAQRVTLANDSTGIIGTIGAITALPAWGTVSTANSTTVNLAGGAVFTGTSENVSGYAAVQVSIFSSHASATDGLSLQQSSNGTNWDLADTYTIPATTGKVYSIQPSANFFRLVYTNGATLTTSLRIQTVFHVVAPNPSSQRPADAYTNETDMTQNWAFSTLYNGTTWDRMRGDITNGLDVDVTRILPGTAATALGKAEDAVHADGDVGVMALAVRKDSAAALAGADGDYAPLEVDASGRLHTVVQSLTPGTAATSLGKAEDAAHASGDTGVMALGVRNDTLATAVTSASGDYSQLATDTSGVLMTAGAPRLLKGRQVTTITSSTTETTIATAVASTFLDVYGLILTNTSATVTKVSIRDATAGGTISVFEVPPTDTRGFMLPLDSAIPQATVNNNWTATCGTSVSALEVTVLYVKRV